MPESVRRHIFRKPEKLCSHNQIDTLFAEGKSLSTQFIRLIFLETDDTTLPAVKVLIAVPKKKLKLAVDRNRMKRLIREAYRVNKHMLLDHYSGLGKHCDIAFVFSGKKCLTGIETEHAIKELLSCLISKHEKTTK